MHLLRRAYQLAGDALIVGACATVMLCGGWVAMVALLWSDNPDPLDPGNR